MKKIIIQMLYSLVTKLFDKQVINSIREFIVRYSSQELEGFVKKMKVTEEVQNQAKDFLINAENYLLSMTIDVVYAYLKSKNEIK